MSAVGDNQVLLSLAGSQGVEDNATELQVLAGLRDTRRNEDPRNSGARGMGDRQ